MESSETWILVGRHGVPIGAAHESYAFLWNNRNGSGHTGLPTLHMIDCSDLLSLSSPLDLCKYRTCRVQSDMPHQVPVPIP